MFSTHREPGDGQKLFENTVDLIRAARPSVNGVAMDSMFGMKDGLNAAIPNMPDALVGWFASQTFIGHQLAAIVAQHWLVDKACTMPARDAIRHGFQIGLSGLDEEDEERDTKVIKELEKAGKRVRLNANMEQFVRLGRIFGIRIVIFDVRSDDPDYYVKPYNPDGVTKGSYRGIRQVDPYWCAPELDMVAAADPDSAHFYEPTWWRINGKRYHRSHLCIFRTSEVPDILKPVYLYGGVPVPQRIMERVYAAERTANEAPQLAMSKRTTVWAADLEEVIANQEKFLDHMQRWIAYRDNFGVKMVGAEDKIQQFDTALADLDTVIMTQYQIVAAAANVPATKLLGTTPKGFNATGEYEESSYHEELESIQSNDLTPLVERHLELAMRSEVGPKFDIDPSKVDFTIDWAALDSPTAKEYAETNEIQSRNDVNLVNAGAIDGMDIRKRIKKDPNSGYTGLADPAALPPPPDDPVTPVGGTGHGGE